MKVVKPEIFDFSNLNISSVAKSCCSVFCGFPKANPHVTVSVYFWWERSLSSFDCLPNSIKSYQSNRSCQCIHFPITNLIGSMEIRILLIDKWFEFVFCSEKETTKTLYRGSSVRFCGYRFGLDDDRRQMILVKRLFGFVFGISKVLQWKEIQTSTSIPTTSLPFIGKG